MSQDHKVVQLLHVKREKSNQLTDRDRIIYAYHYIEQKNLEQAVKLLTEVKTSYYSGEFHKHIGRALLCHATKGTQDPGHGKESEFYLVVYKLTKYIIDNKVHFHNSGFFYQLKDELFKDFM